ncbi:MAG: asparagine synthase-related protein, partial [Steroidobacteraceae bacterium]
LHAAQTASTLGLRSEIALATLEAGEVAQLLAWHLDEPAGDPAALSQYAVFVAARQYTDIALTGHGAAGLWAGYARHRRERLEWMMRSLLPVPLARLGAPAGSVTAAHLAMSPAHACALKHASGLFDDERRHEVYTRTFSRQVHEANPFVRHLDLYRRCGADDPLTRALYVEARTFLPDNHLVIADRASTAAGLRLRHPFLDRELVDQAFALPGSLKLHGTVGMYALRRLASRRLPPTLLPVTRCTAPAHSWLSNAVTALVPHVLLTERFDSRGIFSRPALRRFWEEHRRGRRDHARRFWSVLMLELWFREFIDGDAAAHPHEYAVTVRAA